MLEENRKTHFDHSLEVKLSKIVFYKTETWSFKDRQQTSQLKSKKKDTIHKFWYFEWAVGSPVLCDDQINSACESSTLFYMKKEKENLTYNKRFKLDLAN